MRFGGLIAAIVFAAVAAVVVLRMSAKEETTAVTVTTNTQQPLKTANIYVAAVPIPIGSTISQEMVGIQPWPEHLVLEGFIRADSGTNIIGMVARAAFQGQEPLLSSKLANPNDPNFLAGALPRGMRVLTVQTNEIEGVGGFVFPGDRVDVMLTHQISRWVMPPGATSAAAQVQPREEVEPITETLLTNVMVLAVDQRAASSNTTDKNGNLIIPRSVSLMVSPGDAQRVRLAAQKGTLTLALRSLQDKESTDPLITTSVADISSVQGAGGFATSGTVLVVRGVEATESPSSTGGGSAAATAPTQIVRASEAQAAPTVQATAPAPAPVASAPVIPPSPDPSLPPAP